MIRFAFLGRVSTEDHQDPQASRNWQVGRAQALIEGHGVIVESFFDVGQSRSIPWRRRPEASRLLERLRDPDRGFEAVVIGEPQRAFYGNQFGLTFPVFTHFGVQLWVPEVSGPIDPESEAHDLIMSVFGGMSKGERNRIKIRVRAAMAAQSQVEGRYLGGRPPYGYRLVDAGPHPHPGKAADGKRLRKLEADPVTAPVVRRIFREYLMGFGIFAIAQRLTAEGIACPSAHDHARNRHREGVAWSKSAVRAILTNPRYTGFAVWNKQRKQESLIDVEDVALGNQTRLTWNKHSEWVFSERPAHEALVSVAEFERANARRATRNAKSTGRVVTARTRHPYAFKGLLIHRACGRRMQGNWNHDRPHYRCRYPNEYALANDLDHPKSVYLREDQLVEPLDAWLAEVFHPDRLRHSLSRLEQVHTDTSPVVPGLRVELAHIEKVLAGHRAALEAGADPQIVAEWISETAAQRSRLRTELAALEKGYADRAYLSKAQIAELIDGLGGWITVLRRAEPGEKLEVYRRLGLKLTFDHVTRTVVAETKPQPPVGVVVVSGGGLEPPRPIKGTSTSS